MRCARNIPIWRTSCRPSARRWETASAFPHAVGGLARALPRQNAVYRESGDTAKRGPKYVPTDASRAAQAMHLTRLKAMDRYPDCTFTSPDNLAKHILSSSILDLSVKEQVLAYAEELKRAGVAEGFIHEMAQEVAGDRNLDLEGKKQAVRNAIEIYGREIAGGQTRDKLRRHRRGSALEGAITGRRRQVWFGPRHASQGLGSPAPQQEERRERYVAEVTALGNCERDIALAAYDGEAAGDAIVALAEALHGTNAVTITTFLNSEAKTLEDYGRDHGSNVHLTALIVLRRKLLALAASSDERGKAQTDLGYALGCSASGRAARRGWRRRWRPFARRWRNRRASGFRSTGRRRRTISALRSRTLGERESGTARLEEAVAAYRAALEERTRERVPLDWATTQNNLGNALVSARRAGERHGAAGGGGRGLSRGAEGMDARAGSARLGDDAEQSRHCARDARRAGERHGAPRGGGRGLSRGAGGMHARAGAARLGGDAKQSRHCAATLGERESGTARLEEAVAAYRAALEERTRERVPLDWATTQNNLGIALGGSASGRAGRRGSRRRSRPIARRWRNGRASGFRSTGRRRRTISAMRLRGSASGRAGRRGSRRRSRPIARR